MQSETSASPGNIAVGLVPAQATETYVSVANNKHRIIFILFVLDV